MQGLTSLRLARIHGALVGALLPLDAAFACVRQDGSLVPPVFVIAAIVVLLLSSAATLLVWGVGRVVVPKAFRTHVLTIGAVLLALALGLVGSFAIPAFELLYASYGVEVPGQTRVLFSIREVLWLPLLLLLSLTYVARRDPSKYLRYYAMAVLLETAVLLLVTWALYSGIFVLGCM